jgi:hypothetical protein
MSQYAIIFQVLGVLLALFFIFLTYMNTKTWRWLHVTMTFFVFAAAVTFCVYAAMAMKTRLNWLKYHDDLVSKIDGKGTTKGLAEELELVTRGDLKDVEGKTQSIASVRAELARTILDRGRVWRQLSSTPNADGTVVLNTVPPADPNAPAPAAPSPHNLKVKDVVFAFGETQNADGIIVPSAYLGEFQVTAEAPTAITLAPLLQSPEQARLAQTPNATWTLFEVSPIDGHNWFAGLDDAALKALIPQAMTGLQQAEYQKLIDQYLNDGKDTDETAPEENLWIEVEFTQAQQVPVDAAAVNSLDANPFDPVTGQAVLERVRRAKPGDPPGVVEFEVGDTVVLDKATADNLIGSGVAKLVRRIYRRRLNDYELRFHAIHARMMELASNLRTVALDKAAIEASTAKALEQERVLKEFQTKLDDDIAKAKFERDELGKYSDALAARLATVQGELSQLYRSNKALSRELAETSARLMEENERKTKAATASR